MDNLDVISFLVGVGVTFIYAGGIWILFSNRKK